MYYKLLESYIVTEDGDGAKAYGVCVFNEDAENSPDPREPAPQCICRIEDISFDPEEISEHITLWNELQPTIPQLKILIEDIIDPLEPQN